MYKDGLSVCSLFVFVKVSHKILSNNSLSQFESANVHCKCAIRYNTMRYDAMGFACFVDTLKPATLHIRICSKRWVKRRIKYISSTVRAKIYTADRLNIFSNLKRICRSMANTSADRPVCWLDARVHSIQFRLYTIYDYFIIIYKNCTYSIALIWFGHFVHISLSISSNSTFVSCKIRRLFYF